jgi:hypothetical protein
MYILKVHLRLILTCSKVYDVILLRDNVIMFYEEIQGFRYGVHLHTQNTQVFLFFSHFCVMMFL